jgi:prolyl-tRNA editing enzyme YbaK/EbsC (Cys-tRNA(Pro) deacylase)
MEERMPRRVHQVIDAGKSLGVDVDVRSFPEGTRTALDAARAIGCDVDQIVKSLVFMVAGEAPPDEPVLVLTAGGNRVDPGKVAANAGGTAARKADAAEVRAATGYAIGGVAPFGYPAPLRVMIDPHLTRYDTIWAAAGTPNHVFPIARDELLRVTAAMPADVTEDGAPASARRRDGPDPSSCQAGTMIA